MRERQPLDRNIEGLRGEIQMLGVQLVAFKTMVHELAESNQRVSQRMMRLTFVTAVMAVATLALGSSSRSASSCRPP